MHTRRRSVGVLRIVAIVATIFGGAIVPNFLHASPASAATGVNQQMNYQARLLDSTGAIVPDGNYNIRFKVYQDGAGTAAGNPGGTLKWTELWQNTSSQGVQVKNGYFSVQLGTYCGMTTAGTCQGNSNAGVDFNQDTLWLSIDVGGTSTGPSPTYDGEMLPMRRLGSSPYAINSYQLGGLTAGQFLQLAPATVQGDATTNTSININKTNGTGSLMELQRAGVNVTSVANDGTFSVNNTSNQNVLKVDTSAAAGNVGDLITNSSFENNTTTGWTTNTGCTLSATTSEYQFGTYAGQCTNTATASAGFKYVTGALTPSTTYMFTFYAKASRLGGAVLNFGHVENGGGEDAAGLSLTGQTVLSNGWTRYTLTFRTGATLAAGDYLYIKQSDATLRNLFIDGVTLQTDANSDGAYREGEISFNGTVNSNIVIQGQNSSNAFQVQNSMGTSVFTVDTTDTSLIANGGFEASQQGWAAKGAATIARDSSQRRSGYASLKITSTAAANDGVQYALAGGLGLSPGSYSITFAARNTGANWVAGTLVAGFTNSGGDTNCTLSPSVTTTYPNAFGWTVFTCTATIATTAPTAFYIKQTDTTVHTYWIDSVEVVTGSTVSPYGAGNIMMNGVIKTPVTIQNQSDTTSALSIVDTFAVPHLTVDTINQAVFVGSAIADSNLVLTVLDSRTGSDPSFVYNGAMYYNATTNSFRCSQNGVWVSCIGGMRHANTTVPTPITSTSDTNFGTSYTIPANDCTPGRVYRVTAYGMYTNGSTTTTTTVKIKFGSTVLATTGAVVITANSTFGWQLEGQIICITSGAAGSVEAQGRFSHSTSIAGAAISQLANSAVVGSINTTTTQQLQVSANVSQTTGAPSITLRQLVVEAMGP